MKYSSNYINSLSYSEYLELIVKELNDNGFIETYTGSKYELNIKDPTDCKLFIFSIEDINALIYLKNIGLINNGRCPICGASIPSNIYTYTNRHNSNISFYICKNCYGGPEKLTKQGCMLSLLLVLLVIISSIIFI
jgi:hypothetical protein